MNTGKKILIIDDEHDFLETLGSWLSGIGYRVRVALDGEAGLAAVRRDRPDLIIVDMSMPVMNGYSFYQEIKNTLGCGDIPVLVATGRIEMRDVLEAAGVAGFLTKPFSLKDLQKQVEFLLQ